jgi:hypothetical protein
MLERTVKVTVIARQVITYTAMMEEDSPTSLTSPEEDEILDIAMAEDMWTDLEIERVESVDE